MKKRGKGCEVGVRNAREDLRLIYRGMKFLKNNIGQKKCREYKEYLWRMNRSGAAVEGV